MRFEWDHQKNQSNIKKHNISFEEAKKIFDDPLHISVLDKRFSYFEERWISIGQSNQNKILVAANLFFDDSGEEVIRIISAREATIHERRQYESYR
ncbi:MAG: BrnT family toxin [Spirochaetales bacterium]|nr:BrnT family toxin [Spirochaetales bacterium]